MKLKKSLALILSVVMLLSCMAVSTISASAATEVHTWIVSENTDEDGWYVETEPTCCKTGTMQRQCLCCVYNMEYQSIPATGDHTYGDDGYCTTSGCTAYDAAYDLSTSDTTGESTDDSSDVDVDGSKSGDVDVSYEQEITHVYRVEIEWGSLEFNYKDADSVWNVDTMTWETNADEAEGWTCDDEANVITITNKSSGDVTATISCASVYEGISISAGEDDTITVYSPASEGIDYTAGDHIETFEIEVSGYDAAFTSAELIKIGSVTIILAAA